MQNLFYSKYRKFIQQFFHFSSFEFCDKGNIGGGVSQKRDVTSHKEVKERGKCKKKNYEKCLECNLVGSVKWKQILYAVSKGIVALPYNVVIFFHIDVYCIKYTMSGVDRVSDI